MKPTRETNVAVAAECLRFADPAILEQVVPEMAKDSRRILGQPVPELAGMAIWPQPVAKLKSATLNDFLRQVVAESYQEEGVIPATRLNDATVIEIQRQLFAEIPWGQNLAILNKLCDPAARLWYRRATARLGWTRNVLLNQIKAGAYERAVIKKKTHNFGLVLPEHLAEQADEMLKSSYYLEFLGLRRAVRERELEDRLISRLQAFLLELGYGFCLVGRQYRIVLHGRSRPPRRGQGISAQGRAQPLCDATSGPQRPCAAGERD